MNRQLSADELATSWKSDPRWRGITRPYSPHEVVKLRGSTHIEHTLARMGSERLWELLRTRPFVNALSALTGNQAIQQIQAGLEAIYLSGWQVAGDMNDAGQIYPDQSLYPVDSAPNLIRRLNNALLRADQIQHLDGKSDTYWFAPIVADAEAGFGGPLNTFELTKAMIEAGVAGIHFEDQLSSMKKCGHMGGKVLVPADEYIHKLISARLAADVLDVPTMLIARTDAEDARLIRADHDPIDRAFLTGERSSEGFFYVRNGTDYAIAKARAYAPFVEMLWCETSKPDLIQAHDFAQGVREKFPDKLLAYNCSPSFNWKKYLGDKDLRNFQEKLAEMGYKFQFITLAGFHTLNASMFELALAYKQEGMAAYSRLQEREFELEREHGYRAIKHQTFVGAGYFDEIQIIVSNGLASTVALKDSTEEKQFAGATAGAGGAK